MVRERNFCLRCLVVGNLAGVAIAVVVTVDEAVMNGGNGVGHEVILEHRDDVGRADGQRSDATVAGKVETYDFRNPAFLSEVELRRLRNRAILRDSGAS